MVQFLENLIKALDDFRKGVSNWLSAFIKGIVELLERILNWLKGVVLAIFDYLVRFFRAIFELFFTLIKLSLFYVPALVMGAYYFAGAEKPHLIWLAGSIGWATIVTLAGLFYSS